MVNVIDFTCNLYLILLHKMKVMFYKLKGSLKDLKKYHPNSLKKPRYMFLRKILPL